jgi:hypothetical protein
LPKDEVVVYNQLIRRAWTEEGFRRRARKRLGLLAPGQRRKLAEKM